MDVGTRIREHREAAGMHQDQLAELCHVSRQTISNWERNKTLPDIVSLKVIAHELGTTVDALIGDDIPEIKRRTNSGARQLTALFVACMVCWLFMEISITGRCWDLSPVFRSQLWLCLDCAMLGAYLVIIYLFYQLRKRLNVKNTYYDIINYISEHPARDDARGTRLTQKVALHGYVMIGSMFALAILRLISCLEAVPLPVALAASLGMGAWYTISMRRLQHEGGPVDPPLPPQR